MIQLTFDRTGFPMAKVRNVGSFHLWPVTRFQFRRYMSETGISGKKQYRSLLEQNPEVKHGESTESNYESLFMTGLLPAEALDYARWLGEAFDLPSEEEWLQFYKAVCSETFNFHLSPYGLSSEAMLLEKTLRTFLRSPLAFSFLQDGIVEWVKGLNGFVGRGAPRDSFFPNVWDPEEDSIRVIDCNERLFYFGFRLIKRTGRWLSIE
jgi:hypothetical protein